MQLEVGKKYRTRDGHSIFIITANDYSGIWQMEGKVIESKYPFVIGQAEHFETNGLYGQPGKQTPYDLVEEVI